MSKEQYLDTEGLAYLWRKIKNYISGHAYQIGSPIPVTTAAEMTDTASIYLYMGSESGYSAGYCYYYDGSAWTRGIQYNEAPIRIDDTLYIQGQAADAKAAGDAIRLLESAVDSLEDDMGDVEGDVSGLKENLNDIEDSVGQLQTEVRTGDYVTAETSKQLLSDKFITDQMPYQFRQAGDGKNIGDRAVFDAIVGGSVNYNQLVPDAKIHYTRTSAMSWSPISENYSIPFIKDCVYLIMLNGKTVSGGKLRVRNSSVGIVGDEQSYNFLYKATITDSNYSIQGYWQEADVDAYFNIINITALFGNPAIANYIYSLEQATAGAGVEIFRKMFDKDYYPYNTGELISVKPLKHKTCGKNLIEDVLIGYNINSIGVISSTSEFLLHIVSVKRGVTYYCTNGSSDLVAGFFTEKPVLGSVTYNNIRTVQSDKFITSPIDGYMIFRTGLGYATPQCEIGTQGTSYESPIPPYEYLLDPDLTLRGIPMLDANNNIYFDGDTYEPSGKVTRKYGIVDLGTLGWIKGNRNNDDTGYNFYIGRSDFPSTAPTYKKAGKCCSSKLVTWTGTTSMWENIAVNHICIVSDYIVCTYEANTANYFKTAMSGVILVYELDTPTTETADPYIGTQIVDSYGTEEFVCDTVTPVGHVTKYPENLRKKLDNLPWNFASLIAPTEAEYKATQNYTVNQLLIVNNTLYKVTSNIANGGTITPNTNVIATTLSEVIESLS